MLSARAGARRPRASEGARDLRRWARWYGRVSSGVVSDRSFVRFGGLAGILLALTSWSAVASYYTVAKAGADVIGLQVFQLLYGLIAFWALFGIVAVYWVVRPHGE